MTKPVTLYKTWFVALAVAVGIAVGFLCGVAYQQAVQRHQQDKINHMFDCKDPLRTPAGGGPCVTPPAVTTSP